MIATFGKQIIEAEADYNRKSKTRRVNVSHGSKADVISLGIDTDNEEDEEGDRESE
jgi:hypothetical protein